MHVPGHRSKQQRAITRVPCDLLQSYDKTSTSVQEGVSSKLFVYHTKRIATQYSKSYLDNEIYLVIRCHGACPSKLKCDISSGTANLYAPLWKVYKAICVAVRLNFHCLIHDVLLHRKPSLVFSIPLPS